MLPTDFDRSSSIVSFRRVFGLMVVGPDSMTSSTSADGLPASALLRSLPNTIWSGETTMQASVFAAFALAATSPRRSSSVHVSVSLFAAPTTVALDNRSPFSWQPCSPPVHLTWQVVINL